MNLQGMTKEQKQIWILAGIVSFTVVLALYLYVLKPLMSSSGETAVELASLQLEVDAAGRLLGQKSVIREKYQEELAALSEIQSSYLPDRKNPLSWVSKNMYEAARQRGLKLDSVVSARVSSVRGQGAGGGLFSLYAAEVSLRCGYYELDGLLRYLSEVNPLICVSEISIASVPNDLENHKIQFKVDWPLFSDKLFSLLEEDQGEG